VKQHLLCLRMGGANIFQRYAYRVAKIVVVGTPARNIGVEEFTERWRRPGTGVYAVRNRGDGIVWKHAAGDFTVSHGDSIHISGETERQVGHIERIAMQGLRLFQERDSFVTEQLRDQRLGKLIVPGRDRRVGGEDTHAANTVDVELLDAAGEALIEPAFEQSKREQRRVALVHVVGLNAIMAQFPQELKSTKAENNFLSETIVLVSTIEEIGKVSVPFGILWQIGV